MTSTATSLGKVKTLMLHARTLLVALLGTALLLTVQAPGARAAAPTALAARTTGPGIATNTGMLPPQESWPSTSEGANAKRGYGGVSGSIRTEKPKKTSAWKQRAAKKLSAALKSAAGVSAKARSGQGIASTQSFGFWGCGFALAVFVAQYGIPIFKVAKVLKLAYQEWKTIDRIVDAIRAGEAATVLGQDGLDVFKAFLGAGDLMEKCAGSL